jgi:hypothetical protein
VILSAVKREVKLNAAVVLIIRRAGVGENGEHDADDVTSRVNADKSRPRCQGACHPSRLSAG